MRLLGHAKVRPRLVVHLGDGARGCGVVERGEAQLANDQIRGVGLGQEGDLEQRRLVMHTSRFLGGMIRISQKLTVLFYFAV